MFVEFLRELEKTAPDSLGYKKGLAAAARGFGSLTDEKACEKEGIMASGFFLQVVSIQEFRVFLDLLMAMQEKSWEAFVRNLNDNALRRLVNFVMQCGCESSIGDSQRAEKFLKLLDDRVNDLIGNKRS